MAPFGMQAQGAWATPQAAAAAINALAAGFGIQNNAGAGGLSELAQMVRIGQRKSRPFKAAWQAYCSMNGSNMHDPAKHDDSFITNFLDSLGTLGMERMGMGGQMGGMGMTGQMGGQMGGMGGGLKRGFDQMGGMGMTGMQKKPNLGMADMDPVKMQLVEAVKKYQKEQPEMKVHWHTYCDTELGGSRDPSRHSPEVLKAFLDQQGVPVQIAQLDMSNSPHKMQCVQRVKNFQKESADKKEVWHQYCDAELGGHRDPSRHSAEALQNFLNVYDPQ